MSIKKAIIFLIILLYSSSAWSGTPDFHKGRRQALAEKTSDGIVLLLGGEEFQIYPTASTYFFQTANFYYLTGLVEPDAVLLIVPDKVIENMPYPILQGNSAVFLPEPGKVKAKDYGLDAVMPMSSLPQILSFVTGTTNKIYMMFNSEGFRRTEQKRLLNPWDGRISRDAAFVQKVKSFLPEVEIADLFPKVMSLRETKLPEEIELLRKAIKITEDGLLNVMRNCKPGMYEYELQADLEYMFTKSGSRRLGFYSIVAAGEDALDVHFHPNNNVCNRNELVMIDCGADYGYYTADITRTFPVSGTFTPEQRRIYQTVLDAQKAVIAAMKPRVPIRRLGEIATEIYKKNGFGQFSVHGVGHGLGLTVHDDIISDVLKPGMVMTVEPGLYLADKGIGIRIEDDVLITETGHEILNKRVPKEIDEIEAFMRK